MIDEALGLTLFGKDVCASEFGTKVFQVMLIVPINY
jgi:hypothetical protein